MEYDFGRLRPNQLTRRVLDYSEFLLIHDQLHDLREYLIPTLQQINNILWKRSHCLANAFENQRFPRFRLILRDLGISNQSELSKMPHKQCGVCGHSHKNKEFSGISVNSNNINHLKKLFPNHNITEGLLICKRKYSIFKHASLSSKSHHSAINPERDPDNSIMVVSISNVIFMAER